MLYVFQRSIFRGGRCYLYYSTEIQPEANIDKFQYQTNKKLHSLKQVPCLLSANISSL